MSGGSTLECPSDAFEIELPHLCRRTNTDRALPYTLGDRGRERLAAGQTVPATARCAECEGREFFSLVDRQARAMARRGAAVAARPTGNTVARVREFAGRSGLRVLPAPGIACAACGVVPDSAGHCQCSA